MARGLFKREKRTRTGDISLRQVGVGETMARNSGTPENGGKSPANPKAGSLWNRVYWLKNISSILAKLLYIVLKSF